MLNDWLNRSICRKALVATLTATMTVVIVFEIYAQWSMREMRLDLLHQKAEKTADVHAVAMSGLLFNHDTDGTAALAKALSNDPDVVRVSIIDTEGAIVTDLETDRVWVASLLTVRRPITYYFRGKEQVVGNLIISISDAAARRDISHHMLAGFSSMIFILITLSTVIIWSSRQITTPLRIIATDLLRLANGAEGVRIEGMERADEIGDIAQAADVFSRHAAAIDTMNRHLKAAKAVTEQAVSASQNKTTFLAHMAHDLRTPLNAIIGFSETMMFNIFGPLGHSRYDQYAGLIHKSGKHLLDLINDILDLSSVEAGAVQIELETVRLDEVFAECLSYAKEFAKTLNKNLNFSHFCVCAEMPSVIADRKRLKQVLLNLLSNAIKYNSEGGSVTVDCQKTSDGMLRISIADAGPGIPRHKQSSLFEPFNRLGMETGKIQGTGLGLTITKKLVELMGGSIGVESDEGKGSNFWFDLPLPDAESTETASIPHENKHENARCALPPASPSPCIKSLQKFDLYPI